MQETRTSQRWTWILGTRLGEGGQSVARLARREGDQAEHVLKEPRRKKGHAPGRDEAQQLARFRIEVDILRALNAAGCPNIVRVVDSNLPDSKDEWPWYVMPRYRAGAMWKKDRDPAYLEVYEGDIDRVLEIAEALSDVLVFLHETTSGAHRDVKAGNVFFDTKGGAPILGDFGLAHAGAQHDEHLTDPRDSLGPGRWRPPELRVGGGALWHPNSDVYMLAGLIYEALSGGDAFDEAERANGSFAHEAPEWNLARITNDPRLPYVNTLLRNMFRRDPIQRLSSRAARDAIRSVRAWRPGAPLPTTEDAEQRARDAVATYYASSPAVREERLRSELLEVCARIDREYGLGNWQGPDQITRMVTRNTADGHAVAAVEANMKGLLWAAVRVLVGFEGHPSRPMLMSYTLFGRRGDEEIVAHVDEEQAWRVLARGAPGSPQHEDVLRRSVRDDLERLTNAMADRVRELR